MDTNSILVSMIRAFPLAFGLLKNCKDSEICERLPGANLHFGKCTGPVPQALAHDVMIHIQERRKSLTALDAVLDHLFEPYQAARIRLL